MAKRNIVMSIKTPYKYQKNASMKQVREAITEKVMKRTISTLSYRVKTAYEKNLRVLATFFFRVCCRTPLDEPYSGTRTYVDEKGVEHTRTIKHWNDEEQIRGRWALTNGTTSLTAREIYEDSPEIFDDINNIDKLLVVEEFIRERFGLEISKMTISNDSVYFEALEYGKHDYEGPGAWLYDTEPIQAAGNLYEHGVKNQRSVQAPLGMLRMTILELPNIQSFPPAFKDKFYVPVDKNISNAKARELLKKLSKRTAFTFADIKELVDFQG